MTTIKRTNLLIIIFSIIAFFYLPVFSGDLSSQTLQNDISYYQRVSSQKNMTANDRAYILDRIKEKYDGSGIDMAPLEREIKQASENNSVRSTKAQEENTAVAKQSQSNPDEEQSSVTIGEESYTDPAGNTTGQTTAKHLKPSTGNTKGKVEKIFVSESKTESKIIIAAAGVSRSNYFLMKDPSSGKPPKIVLDLYGAQSKLKTSAMNINPKTGLFSNVSSGQFEGPPNNIVRITASLRQDNAYRVTKQGGLYIIVAVKSAAAQKPAEETKTPAASTETTSPLPAEASLETGSAPQAIDISPSSAKTAGIKPAPAETISKSNNDYKIEDSDILGITIYPSDELSREVVVQPDGNISFPLIGSCQAKGLTIKQLENTLAERLAKFITAPQVSITVKQFSRRQIFITGEVKSVGAFSYKENLRLMEFISSLGGFTDGANRREIKIYRGPPTKRETHTVNDEEIMKSGDFSKDFLLEAGDIIEVQRGAAKVALLGDVRTPGYYDYKENMRLIELISSAGGYADTAKITEISIIRQEPNNSQKMLKVNFKNILAGKQKDFVIQSGDTVYFPKGKLESANYFLSNILPWLTLITMLFVVRAGI